MRRTIAVNRDIMIRSAGADRGLRVVHGPKREAGRTILAANAVLMQFVTFAAFFLDGLAFAAEALIGKAVGAAEPGRADRRGAPHHLLGGGGRSGCVLVFAVTGATIIDLLTVDEGVRALRGPICRGQCHALAGVWGFQLDGIFIGATRTAEMRNAMLAALAIFLVAWWLLTPYGNHGLWAALYVLYAARTATLLYYLPALVRSIPE